MLEEKLLFFPLAQLSLPNSQTLFLFLFFFPLSLFAMNFPWEPLRRKEVSNNRSIVAYLNYGKLLGH